MNLTPSDSSDLSTSISTRARGGTLNESAARSEIAPTLVPHGELVLKSEQVTDRRAGNHDEVKCRLRLPGSHVALYQPEPFTYFRRGLKQTFFSRLEHFGLTVQAGYVKGQLRSLLCQRQSDSARAAAQLKDLSGLEPPHQRHIELYVLAVAQVLQVVFFGMPI